MDVSGQSLHKILGECLKNGATEQEVHAILSYEPDNPAKKEELALMMAKELKYKLLFKLIMKTTGAKSIFNLGTREVTDPNEIKWINENAVEVMSFGRDEVAKFQEKAGPSSGNREANREEVTGEEMKTGQEEEEEGAALCASAGTAAGVESEQK